MMTNDINLYYYYRYREYELQKQKELIDNTLATGGLVGAVAGVGAYMSGSVPTALVLNAAGLGSLAGTGIGSFAAFGLTALGATFALPVATIAAIAVVKMSPYAFKAAGFLLKGAFKGAIVAGKFAFKTAKKFNYLSAKSVKKFHNDKDNSVLKDFAKNKVAEKRFKSLLKEVKQNFKNGKDISKSLKDLYQYRVPSIKAQQKLSNLTADYVIKKTGESKGQVDPKLAKEEYKKLAKEFGWSRSKLRAELANFKKRVEFHKDNLNIKEDGQLSKFAFKKQKSFNKKAELGKSLKPAAKAKTQIQQQSQMKKQSQEMSR